MGHHGAQGLPGEGGHQLTLKIPLAIKDLEYLRKTRLSEISPLKIRKHTETFCESELLLLRCLYIYFISFYM